MKIVDTKEYVSALRDLTEQGHEVNMLIAGNSMSPFLVHERDYIYFSKPNRDLRVGDIVFFQRDNGDYVMHRICKVNNDGTYDIIGDGQYSIERGVRRDQIFAIITCVKRKGKIIRHGNFCWDFFEKVWVRIIPLRSLCRFAYSVYVRVKRIFRR